MSSTKRGSKRAESDFYPTPLEAFDPLIPFLPTVKIWEPASGDGRLIVSLMRHGFDAGGDDLKNGYDFLKDNTKRECIVTNPPYSLAQEFVQHALEVSPEVFMLLRINFLGAQKRNAWWKLHEPSALYVLSARPDFTGGGGDSCEYAWFNWGDSPRGIFHL